MNIENMKSLAEIVSAYGLTSLEVEDNDKKFKVKLKRELTGSHVGEKVSGTLPSAVTAQVSQSPQAQQTPQVLQAPQNPQVAESAADHSHLFEVKSPLVGVFYSAPSPDADMFVTLGSKVKKGDVLCIIETMKLMNEITAEQDGEIVDICIKNGDIAEFGQVLFKMA